MEAIASRLEAMVIRMEAIASRNKEYSRKKNSLFVRLHFVDPNIVRVLRPLQTPLRFRPCPSRFQAIHARVWDTSGEPMPEIQDRRSRTRSPG